MNSLKIHSLVNDQNLEIGDLIYLRNSILKLDSDSQYYYLDQESKIEIGHRFLSDEIIPLNYKLTDLNHKIGLENLIKWGSKQDWIRFSGENSGHQSIKLPLVRTFKVFATFSKLIIINALGQEIQVHDFKDFKEFIYLLCNIRCDICQKCNFRQDFCIYCKSSLEFCKRTDLPDLRMEIDCLDGLKVIKLGDWCDLWFPEIIQFPSLKSEYVYHRFNRTIKRIKELKQVSMVLQQVSKSYFLLDVE